MTEARARRALLASGGKIASAATELGITRHSLRRIMLRYGIERVAPPSDNE